MVAAGMKDETPTRVVHIDEAEPGRDLVPIHRGSRYAPAFEIESDASFEARCHFLRDYARQLERTRWVLESACEQLAGKRLACTCPPQMCHGHVLALLADGVTDDPHEAARIVMHTYAPNTETDSSD
jgi:hypothetical protein